MKWFREKSKRWQFTLICFLAESYFNPYVIKTPGFNIYFLIVTSLILDTTCFEIFIVENDLPMTEQIKMDNKDVLNPPMLLNLFI